MLAVRLRWSPKHSSGRLIDNIVPPMPKSAVPAVCLLWLVLHAKIVPTMHMGNPILINGIPAVESCLPSMYSLYITLGNCTVSYAE